jgi:hypothetical protein
MRSVNFPMSLMVKVDSKTRQAVEAVATQNGISLGEVARDLLREGMRARGML